MPNIDQKKPIWLIVLDNEDCPLVVNKGICRLLESIGGDPKDKDCTKENCPLRLTIQGRD